MEFVKVESSQIDSVGFGDGVYGPETLGVRFKSKSGITEYHYQNVTPQIHFEMMSSPSIGAYFTQNIKRNPALYPFVKVEADPTEPASAKASASESGQNGINTTKTILSSQPSPVLDGVLVEGLTSDAPSPGSALAEIDAMEDDKLFAPGGVTDAQLEAGRQWYLAEAKKRDISTEKSRAEFKRFARPLQKLRTGIEARAKELTGATKRKIAAIDTEKRRLVQIVGGIEDEVLGPLTQWEQEEEARKIKLAGKVKALEGLGEISSYVSIPALEETIADVESFDTTTMQEYRLSAESAKEALLRRLRPELERRKVAEAERLELEKFRAAQAEMIERDRLAEQQRREEERIAAAAKKLADEQIQQAVEAAKVETRQEVIAELAAPVESKLVEENEPDAPELYVYPEIPQSAPPQTQGGIVETHEQRFNGEIIAGLMGFAAIDRQTAIRVLTAIKAGNVPHIQIVY